MMKQKENNAVCELMYRIRDSVNSDDSIGALSLANDLYFMLLRATIEDRKIKCKEVCDERI